MYFYPFGKSTYSFSYACANGKILRDTKVGVMYFSCVASAAHFLFCGCVFMTDIELIRELHCYKNMYNCLQKTITECIKTGIDLVMREKLIKAQQEAEEIYTGEIYDYKTLSADERVIVALLKYIMNSEIEREDGNMEIVHKCIEWSMAIQNINVELSEEFVKEQLNRIFNTTNKEKDSEQ